MCLDAKLREPIVDFGNLPIVRTSPHADFRPNAAVAPCLALLAAIACGCTSASDDTGSAKGTAAEDATSEATADDAEAGTDTDSPGMGDVGDGDGDGDGDGPPPPGGRPAGVFGGGPLYSDAATVFPRLKQSGFDTVVIWTIHVSDAGDLILNDKPLVSDGQWIGDADWPALVETLEVAPTTIQRVELGVGSAGVPDFERIAALIDAEGTGPDSILFRNFAVIADRMPSIDAINFDDESAYDLEPTLEFSFMLERLGWSITLTPYEAIGFWSELYIQANTQSLGIIDRIMLQKYAGGAFNDPAGWAPYFPKVDIEVGLWSRHGAACDAGDTPAEVHDKMASWADQTAGGWMWLLDDMLTCDAQFPLEDYADAIDTAYAP